MDAETVYLFRHAMVREAAYELQPPSDRAELHVLALRIFESMYGTPPPLEKPAWTGAIRHHPTDAHVLELIEHADNARLADIDPGGEYAAKAAHYLYRAAYRADRGFRLPDALALWEQLIDHPGVELDVQIHAHFMAGQVLYRLGRLEDAVRHYEQGEELFDPEQEPLAAVLFDSAKTIVRSHFDNGPYVGESHRRSAEFWRDQGDKDRQMASTINYAIWHCEEGDTGIARAKLQEAIGLAIELDNLRGEEAAVGTLAILDGHEGRIEESQQGLARAIEIAREMGNTLAEIYWASAQAGVLFDAERYEESEARYREAIALAEREGYDARRDEATARMAATLVALNREAEARKSWNTALPRIRARGDEYAVRTTIDTMQKSLRVLGRPPLNEDGTLG